MMSEIHRVISEIYQLTVKDLIEPLNFDECCVEKSDDIEQVFLLLKKKNHVWVVDNKILLQVIGIVTCSDALQLFAPAIGSLESFDSPSLHSFQFGLSMKVEELMSTLPITVDPQEKIADSIIKMKQHKVKQLAVIDENKRLIGEISLNRLIREYFKRCEKIPK